MVDQAHPLLAWLSVVIVGVVLVTALAALLVDQRLRRILDLGCWLRSWHSASLLWPGCRCGSVEACGDPLHLVYAVALPVALIGGRLFLARPKLRDRLIVFGVWAIVLLGIALRLFMTGGGA